MDREGDDPPHVGGGIFNNKRNMLGQTYRDWHKLGVIVVDIDREPFDQQWVIQDGVTAIDFLVVVIVGDRDIGLGSDKDKGDLDLVE